MKKFKVVLASNNKNKLYEYRNKLEPFGIEVFSLEDMFIKDSPIENGKTYEENAIIKAKEIRKFTNLPIIADDSGLEIEAFNGDPGIQSHRFANCFENQILANEEILRQLRNKGRNRKAKFVCNICFLLKDNYEIFEGVTNGKINRFARGKKNGFDPIFYSTDTNVYFGKISLEEKNKCSHRGKACDKLIEYLKRNELID